MYINGTVLVAFVVRGRGLIVRGGDYKANVIVESLYSMKFPKLFWGISFLNPNQHAPANTSTQKASSLLGFYEPPRGPCEAKTTAL